jgi:uncharacterized Zn finger protein
MIPMSWNFYRPYVSVAQRRAKAAKHAQKLAKKGKALAPVRIEGRAIARTFWGKAWCGHLESFSDYANRLPRGRTYVRNGSVLDVQIAPGKITAMIMGSTLYHGTIAIAPLKPAHWQAIKAECAGKIDSLVGLLQGRLSDAVMRVITDREKGLFPQPSEIKLACSCPDWADLCKHLAAVLYGVGARLDTQPELLFLLRGVDHLELISAAADAPALGAGAGAETSGLDAAQLSDVFGIEIEPAAAVGAKPAKAAAGRQVGAAASTARQVKKSLPPKAGKSAGKKRKAVTPKTATKRVRKHDSQ